MPHSSSLMLSPPAPTDPCNLHLHRDGSDQSFQQLPVCYIIVVSFSSLSHQALTSSFSRGRNPLHQCSRVEGRSAPFPTISHQKKKCANNASDNFPSIRTRWLSVATVAPESVIGAVCYFSNLLDPYATLTATIETNIQQDDPVSRWTPVQRLKQASAPSEIWIREDLEKVYALLFRYVGIGTGCNVDWLATQESVVLVPDPIVFAPWSVLLDRGEPCDRQLSRHIRRRCFLRFGKSDVYQQPIAAPLFFDLCHGKVSPQLLSGNHGADCVINFDESVKMWSLAGVDGALQLRVFVTFETQKCLLTFDRAEATARVNVSTKGASVWVLKAQATNSTRGRAHSSTRIQCLLFLQIKLLKTSATLFTDIDVRQSAQQHVFFDEEALSSTSARGNSRIRCGRLVP